MEMALVHNKPKFVELILENDIKLADFLTKNRLLSLYEPQNIPATQNITPKTTLYQLSSEDLSFQKIKKLFKKFMFQDFDPKFLKECLVFLFKF